MNLLCKNGARKTYDSVSDVFSSSILTQPWNFRFTSAPFKSACSFSVRPLHDLSQTKAIEGYESDKSRLWSTNNANR